MKNLKSFLSIDDLFTDIVITTALVFIFMALGYFSREFALDLQTNFFAF